MGMNQIQMEAIVFDMDGILFDTERLCMEGWKKVAGKKDLQGIEEVCTQCIGLSACDTRKMVINYYGEDFPYEDFRSDVTEWIHKRIERKGLPVKEGAKNLLPWLEQAGYKLGLASSTNYASVIKHLKRAEMIDFFQVVVGGDMVEHSKPQPDIYQLACRKLDVEPQMAYAIEDSPNGIRSASSAGLKPIMVPDLIRPDEEMEGLSFMICDSLLDVMNYFSHLQDLKGNQIWQI